MKHLIKIVKKAGEIAIAAQAQMAINIKSDKSIVTNGDLLVSDFLEKELKIIYPDYDVFSEENTSKIPTKNKVIVIDPIDGTESYSRKQDSWSILIGFLEEGIPVGGLVYQPTIDNLYYGFKGLGAYQVFQGKRSKLISDSIGDLKGVASFSNYGEHEFLNNLGITEFNKMYSAALKIMKVASGEVDIYPNFRKKCSIWDLIAPQAILEEAGGKIIYENPAPIDFKNTHIDQNICAVSTRVHALNIKQKP